MSRRRPNNPQLFPPLQPLPPPQPAQPPPQPAAQLQPPMQHMHHDRMEARVPRCCAPTECVRVFTSNNNGKEALIHDLRDAVRVVCNNDTCTFGEYMHRECFDQFEQSVLTYLKSCGRARSWSERQRCQNLWTKKGYDLAFKACGCRCGRGHLRKDLDWTPPAATPQREEEAAGKKKKRRNKNNARPVLTLNSVPHYAAKNDPNNNFGGEARGRAGSLSSGSTGSSSPPANGILATGLQTPGLTLPGQPHGGAISRPRKVANKGEVYAERNGAGGNGIFARRLDFSSFNVLPRIRLNSYHIKVTNTLAPVANILSRHILAR
ncbi:headcase protein-like [Thrips palmi]|uniref:Headcase protein-like n=1 Tax=Thrips palmi TaxID=161013 RepID=A0A6P9A013_THRPL|nr:headcase protein-like [Thrips palmi]